MPTRSDGSSPATIAADNEAAAWERVVTLVESGFPAGGPTEASVVRFHDPSADLEARAARWGFTPVTDCLDEVARFAGGLALAEARARRDGQADIALAAYVERRRLVGDRLVHWAVPWLLAASAQPGDDAGTAARLLLEVADRLHPVPATGAVEGLYPPGEDSYGPVDPPVPIDQLLTSVWSGQAAGDTRGCVDRGPDDFAAAALIWRRLAADHPGTAQLWLDLAARAERSAQLLRCEPKP